MVFSPTCPDPQFRDPAEAVKLAGMAVKQVPGNADYLSASGAAKCAASQWKEAIADLMKASAIRKEVALGDAFLLATAHARLGEVNCRPAVF